MAVHSDPGLIIRSAGLAVAVQDLHGMQGAIVAMVDAMVAGMTVRPGPVCPASNLGTLDTVWRTHDDDVDEIVAVQARGVGASPAHALLITADGKTAPFDPVPDDEIIVPFSGGADEIPQDGNWYSVLVRVIITSDGIGALSVTSGSAAIAGDRTQFLRMAAAADFPTGTLSLVTQLVVSGTSSNDGTYSVATITDDDTLTVTSNFLATEVIPPEKWSIRGRWLSVAMESADKTVLQRRSVEFEITARTAVPDAGDFVLADVFNDSGTLRFIDRREGSCALFAQQFSGPRMGRRISVMPGCDVGPTTLVTMELDQNLQTSPVDVDTVSCAPTRGGLVLSVYVDTSSTNLYAMSTERLPFGLDTPVSIDTGVSSATIVALPYGHPETHHVYYVKSSILYQSVTEDNGATWSAATQIWDPTNSDPANTLRDPWACVLHNGRIVIVVSYKTVAVTKRTIRYAYSDDYGATWLTNSDAGNAIVADVSAHLDRPGLAQDITGRLLLTYEAEGTPRNIRTRINANPSGTAWGTLTTGPTISALGTDACYRGNPLGGVLPGFTVLFLHSDTTLLSAGRRYVSAAVINGEPETANLNDLFFVDAWLAGGSDAQPAVAMGACYAQSGEIHIFYTGEQADNFLTHTRVIESPTLSPMSLSG